MGSIKAKIAKLLHMEMASANIKNVYNPLISFSVSCIFLFAVIMGISIIYGKEIIAYIFGGDYNNYNCVYSRIFYYFK